MIDLVLEKNVEPTIDYFKADIANMHFEIECSYRNVFYACKDYLSKFSVPDYVVSVSTLEDIEEERAATTMAEMLEGEITAYYSNAVLETLAIQRKVALLLFGKDILLIHGAAIAADGKCYIFIAKSGTGKTTLIKKWMKLYPDSFVVNGDKPFVDVAKLLVWGSPWCGKERMNTNTSVPLGGLIWLERGETNEIEPISFAEMLPCLIKQTHFPEVPDSKLKVMKLLAKLKDIPCWRLKCNMDDEAGEVSYNALVKGEY